MPAPKEIQIFSDLEHTFNTPGWSHLVDGWKEERDAIPLMAFTNVKTMEELEAYRVRYELLSQLIGLPEDIAADQEALKQDVLNVETNPV
jgi:hypothetical protein